MLEIRGNFNEMVSGLKTAIVTVREQCGDADNSWLDTVEMGVDKQLDAFEDLFPQR